MPKHSENSVASKAGKPRHLPKEKQRAKMAKKVGGRKDLPIWFLRQQLDYDKKSGLLSWKIQFYSRRMGTPFRYGSKGYLRFAFNRRLYSVHRAIFAMHYGFYPQQIDHKNGVKHDNRISNLRAASHVTNGFNRKKVVTRNESGVKGVCWARGKGKWYARITSYGRVFNLGYFKQIEDAIKVRKQAAERLHGGFVNHG